MSTMQLQSSGFIPKDRVMTDRELVTCYDMKSTKLPLGAVITFGQVE